MGVIGGRAHLNGITFATNTHVVRGRLSKGMISIRVRRVPGIRIFMLMDKVPFLRGISSLLKLDIKLFLGVILFLTIPWDWFFPVTNFLDFDSTWKSIAAYCIVFLILMVSLRRMWQFHGAEHKAYNIYVSCGELSLKSVRGASRISEHCGTNLAVLAIPIAILLSFTNLALPLIMIALAISYEIYNRSFRKFRLRPVKFVAGMIQKYIVTVEPTDEQILLATATLTKAIEYS
ncbi:hypothetical protein DEAC_c27030 [Desulfosporosinus acididurans]|uniref:Metal-dependent enzyme n=1 Tax=Desulfosporosinus acididurans TaxID=476652 RepID=A0A0J1ILJ0_9FIRM|nr:DUF1385 domain-containing protein [Desulfosporosinus acididurans]KLU65566.1 hypothetical protein DEAC_c27030 [Desulfosporosinus acididurans]